MDEAGALGLGRKGWMVAREAGCAATDPATCVGSAFVCPVRGTQQLDHLTDQRREHARVARSGSL
jgi:hypothetical protein